jgi:hypothetical protein
MLFRNVVRKQRTMAQMSTHIFSALLYRLQTPTPNTIDDIFYSNISCECKKYKDKSNEIISFSTNARVGFTQAILVCLWDVGVHTISIKSHVAFIFFDFDISSSGQL